MKLIIELITDMRGNEPLYCGRVSISRLAYFIRGYSYAMRLRGGDPDIEVMNRFQQWVQVKFKISLTRGWDEIILFHSADEVEAVDYFWQLFDEFLSFEKHLCR